jgi:hypothetical protein
MLQSEIIAIVTSVKKPNKTLCNVVNEEKQVEIYERDNNFILPHIDAYTLRVCTIILLVVIAIATISLYSFFQLKIGILYQMGILNWRNSKCLHVVKKSS